MLGVTLIISYSIGLDKLLKCKAKEDDLISNKAIIIESIYSSLYYKLGEVPI